MAALLMKFVSLVDIYCIKSIPIISTVVKRDLKSMPRRRGGEGRVENKRNLPDDVIIVQLPECFEASYCFQHFFLTDLPREKSIAFVDTKSVAKSIVVVAVW